MKCVSHIYVFLVVWSSLVCMFFGVVNHLRFIPIFCLNGDRKNANKYVPKQELIGTILKCYNVSLRFRLILVTTYKLFLALGSHDYDITK